MSNADRILDIIDGGLQHSTELDYGTDIHPDRCARCQRNDPAEGGNLCIGCRAFLIDDSDVDPVKPVATIGRRLLDYAASQEGIDALEAAELRRFTAEFATNVAAMRDAFEAVAQAINAAAPAITLHRHAQELSDDSDMAGRLVRAHPLGRRHA